MFYPHNAATKSYKGLPIEQFKGIEALKKLFDDEITYQKSGLEPQTIFRYDKKSFLTTSQQAEVQCLEIIETKYIDYIIENDILLDYEEIESKITLGEIKFFEQDRSSIITKNNKIKVSISKDFKSPFKPLNDELKHTVDRIKNIEDRSSLKTFNKGNGMFRNIDIDSLVKARVTSDEILVDSKIVGDYFKDKVAKHRALREKIIARDREQMKKELEKSSSLKNSIKKEVERKEEHISVLKKSSSSSPSDLSSSSSSGTLDDELCGCLLVVIIIIMMFIF